MGRAPCCDKANVKRGPWSPEEDSLLKNYLHKHGTAGNWISLPHKAGLRRCGKSCRLRWLNYLRPDIRHGGFTEAEDDTICTLYSSIGSRWSVIASQLPGRTDNDVKNYWNTRLKKKVLGAAGKNTSATNLKITNNDNMITNSSTSHLNPTQFSSSFVQTCNYGNSANYPCPMEVSCQPNFDPQRLQQVSEFGTSSGSNSYVMSSSLEVSSLSNTSPSIASLGTGYGSWPPVGASFEEDKILLEFGFEYAYGLPNDFNFQEQSSGVAPY